ncbi:Hypothetical protein SRAE_X000086900 [Strongyloides ratti]|uniref:Uncharacterized protein n=1 Tax=Strongyloides ratti TaxID=34506 RepID=A0A090LNV3_STRRB|nr:Hypothetical protein SRAE_X000086900 [Strongyloides ratti]CEF71545.1 Hypothetical protein SRAE_X000086900 [Strongyloides ratti]
MKNIILSIILFVLIVALTTANDTKDNKSNVGQQTNEITEKPKNENQQLKRLRRQNDGDNFIDNQGFHMPGYGNNEDNQPWTGQHWDNNPWSGHYFPTSPSNIDQMWQAPQNFGRHIPRHFNPWYSHHHHHGRPSYPSYNMADKYAYDYFKRNGFTIKSVLTFCTNYHISSIINYSRSLKNFCSKIKENYGNDSIPTYPKTPETSGTEEISQ